ncbi:MAG: TatD family hydrolase [bacterium]
MLIDTHAHLFIEILNQDLDGIIERARESGVTKFIVPGLNLETSQQAIALAKRFPGIVYASVGIHPEEEPASKNHVALLEKLIEKNRKWVTAVGEIGTDANTTEIYQRMDQQKELMRLQCEIAIRNDLPVIIHTRKSLLETWDVLDSLRNMPRGVFHSFSHDEEGMNEILKRGFYIGFGGSVSYSKRIQNIAKIIPNDKYLLETDAPFLPRDFLNEPSSVTILASHVANLRGESVNTIANETTNNARKLFNI